MRSIEVHELDDSPHFTSFAQHRKAARPPTTDAMNFPLPSSVVNHHEVEQQHAGQTAKTSKSAYDETGWPYRRIVPDQDQALNQSDGTRALQQSLQQDGHTKTSVNSPEVKYLPTSPVSDYVSAYVVIDPNNPDTFHVPMQLLTYQNRTIAWGPVTLPSHHLPGCHRPKGKRSSPMPHSDPFDTHHPCGMNWKKRPYENSVTPESSESTTMEPPPFFNSISSNRMGPLHASTCGPVVSFARDSSSMSTTEALLATNAEFSAQLNASQLTWGTARNEEKLLPVIKPLTAFNYFYRDERNNIVGSGDAANLPPPMKDFSESKKQQLLHEHWYTDPHKKRRRHRKSHGLIEFTT